MKVFKNYFFPIIVSILFLGSCKKKEDNTPEATSTQNPGIQTGNYGVFVSRKQTVLTNTLLSSFNNFSAAYISNVPLIGNDPTVGSLVDVGNVELNGIVLKKNAYGAPNMYGDTTNSTYNTPLNWIISGTGSVTSFSFSNTSPYPVYTGYSAIADSFLISNNISIPLNNYSGVDEIETYFVTSSNPATNTNIQNLTGNPSNLNFTSTDLNAIGTNSNVTLVINFYKNNTQTINGKSYNFRTGYSLMKSNIKFK